MEKIWRLLGARAAASAEAEEPQSGDAAAGDARELAATKLDHHLNALGQLYPRLGDIKCALTSRVMRDPVRAADGFVYDRSSIEAWIGGYLGDWAGSSLSPRDVGELEWRDENAEMKISLSAAALVSRMMVETEATARKTVGAAPLTREALSEAVGGVSHYDDTSLPLLLDFCDDLLTDVAQHFMDDGEQVLECKHVGAWATSTDERKAVWEPREALFHAFASSDADSVVFSPDTTDEDIAEALLAAARRAESVVLSPKTREPMATTLTPEVDLRRSIDALLGRITASKDGSVEAALALAWEPRGEQREPRRVDVSDVDLETLEGPASADLAIALSKVFRKLDPVRALLSSALDGWEPPKIVVIGDESVGKSTILEQLCQLPLFPRKRRFCTKLAILVRLRRQIDDAAPQTVTLKVVATDGGGLLERHVLPIENSFEWVADKMQELVDAAAATSASGVVEDKQLVLDVCHPAVPSIDLVDLPGLVSADRQRPKRPAATRAILRREVEAERASGGNAFYVAIVPASGDVRPSCNGAMEFVVDSGLADKTFGVFSKADQLTAETDILRSLMTGVPTADGDAAGDVGHVDLGGGWVVSTLKPPAPAAYFDVHSYERLFLQKQRESEYFAETDDAILRELNAQGLCGVGALVRRLEERYNEYLHTTWKDGTIHKILERLEDLHFQRNLLGADAGAKETLARDELLRRLGDPSIYKAAMAKVSLYFDGALKTGIEGLAAKTIRAENINEVLAEFRKAVDAQLGAALAGAEMAWLVTLAGLLTAEVNAEPADGGYTLLVGLAGAKRFFSSMFGFEGGASRRAITKAIEARPFVQLSNYPDYTEAAVDASRAAFLDARRAILEDATAMVFDLTSSRGLSERWFRLVPNAARDAVQVELESGGFIDKLLSIVMRHMPSPKTLAPRMSAIALGAESEAVVGRRLALCKEIDDVHRALEGVVDALEISAEELAAFRAAHAGEPSTPKKGKPEAPFCDAGARRPLQASNSGR